MGTEKALIMFEGEALWRRQIRLLRQLKPEQILLSVRVARPWLPPEMELLVDDAPSRGPMSGIGSALRQMETSHLLVLAVDMPFLSVEDLLVLMNRAGTGCGVVPVIGERAEPLAAIYPKEACAEFAAALSTNDTSLQPLVTRLAEIGKMRLAPLSQGDAERYRSVNRPKDLLACPACR